MLATVGECCEAWREQCADRGIGRKALRAREDQDERGEHTRIYYLPASVLVPKFVTTLRDYDREQFTRDVIAGVIVGIVALPLAIAFAIASGLSPERGLYTAIVAGFLISLLGGGAIKFIPFPVTIGFTSGIALIIFSSQIRDLLGLEMQSVPSAFLPKWDAYVHAFDTVNPWALVVAVAAFAIILVWPKISTRIPGPFVALIVTTALAQLLHLPVETIGARFGEIHAGLARPAIPHLSIAIISSLAAPAFTIALLGAIESLLSAVVADGMIGGRHRSNMELVAQGVANIASP